MKYRTLQYFQKILHCKEVEDDIREFRSQEPHVRKQWQYQTMMMKDIVRTQFLKGSGRLVDDV